ncbi:MAG: transcriptional regulator [Citrobacter freundii]|nr:MAG: transcriptional regulator [Citrobacter freundii]
MERKIHQGRNIARFRQMLGLKQEGLADALGEDWTQLKVTRLEAKEEIDLAILEEVARVMKIPVQAIQNFDEEAAINIVANTFSDFKDNAVASAVNYYPTFNPIDKVVEILEKINKEKDHEIARLRNEIDQLRNRIK